MKGWYLSEKDRKAKRWHARTRSFYSSGKKISYKEFSKYYCDKCNRNHYRDSKIGR